MKLRAGLVAAVIFMAVFQAGLTFAQPVFFSPYQGCGSGGCSQGNFTPLASLVLENQILLSRQRSVFLALDAAVQSAQPDAARIGELRRDLEATVARLGEVQSQLSAYGPDAWTPYLTGEGCGMNAGMREFPMGGWLGPGRWAPPGMPMPQGPGEAQ